MSDLLSAYSTLISIVIAFGAGTSVLFLVIGAVKYQTSGGNPQQMETAKTTMMSAVVGLVVMLMSFPIVNMITSTVGEAPGAVLVQQVAGTDTQRLDAARVLRVEQACPIGSTDKLAVAITFTEQVTVEGTVRLATDRGAMTLKNSGDERRVGCSGTGINPDIEDTVVLFFGWGPITPSSSDPEIDLGTEIKQIVFERGSSIKDSDGNNALVAFDRIFY